MRFNQSFPLPHPSEEAKRLHIVFNVTRAHPLRLFIDPSLVGFLWTLALNKALPNVLTLDISESSREYSPEIEVWSEFERLQLIKYVFEDGAGKPLVVYAPDPNQPRPEDPRDLELLKYCRPDPNDGAQVQRAFNAVSAVFGPREYLDALWDLLEKAPPTELVKYCTYFADLDRNTEISIVQARVGHPKYPLTRAEAEEITDAVGLAMAPLEERIVRRAKMFLKNPTSCPLQPLLLPDLVPYIGDLSKLQLDLMREHFPRPGNAIDLERFEDAFEMFANGDLRLQLPNKAWTTEPSSGFFFFFAEFALLAIDLNIDSLIWKELLHVMVRVQKIFARLYQPADPTKARFPDYKADNFDYRRQYTGAEETGLEATLYNASAEDLCMEAARNTIDAFPGLL